MTDEANAELKAFETLAFESLAELTQIHIALYPDGSMQTFLQLFKSLRDHPGVSGETALAQIEEAQDKGEAAKLQTALTVSSAYLAEAHQHADNGRIGRAWCALAHASYWRGVMRSVTNKIDLTLQAVDAIRKAESGLGGKKHGEKYAAAKELVIRIAFELKPAKGYDSRRHAFKKIDEYLSKKKPGDPALTTLKILSADRWERTFSDWLGDERACPEFCVRGIT